MADEYEYKDINTGIDVLKVVIDECERQTEKSPCECIMERVKLMKDVD